MQNLTAFPNLLSPLDLGPRTLRNRVQVTAHTTHYIGARHLPDDRDVAYFAERARGGAALVTMGTSAVHPSSPLPYGVYRNFDDEITPRYRAVAEAVHAHGGLVQAQLGHLAQRVYDLPQPMWSPSPVSIQGEGRIPHEMAVAEIDEVVEAFAAAARRAIDAGMDGVEVQCGHGQLVNLFLSPLSNRRDDAYGGDPVRRLRFACEVVRAIGAAIGDQHVIGLRVNASDQIEGGMEEDEALAAISALADLGVAHYVNVSANFFDSPIPTMHHPHGLMLPYARQVREQIGLPVFCVGRIVDPEMAEQVVADGTADVVGMTRAHIADPHVVRKLVEGRREQIRPCIGCVQMCVGELHKGRSISCVYNAVTGYEGSRGARFEEPAETQRRVVVVGGGPGGLEAARVAARRGHQVTLLERRAELGGALDVCAVSPGREEFGRARDWLVAEVTRLGVDVHTGVDASADAVRALDPDVVIVATGARSATGDWGSEDGELILAAREVMARAAPPIGRVLVVDEDHRGQALFVATWLVEAGCEVAVSSSRVVVGGDLEHHTLEDQYALVLGQGAELLPGWVPEGVEPGRVRLRNVFSGHVETRPVDYVVGTGARPDDELATALAPHVEVRVVGDARSPRRMESAVHEAFDAAVGV